MKEIRSLGEMCARINNLIILIVKIARFQYGNKYWEEKRQEEI